MVILDKFRRVTPISMEAIEALAYPYPRKSRHTVTFVDNQGLNPLQTP